MTELVWCIGTKGVEWLELSSRKTGFMTQPTDQSTWDTFKRLWPSISLYKAGLGVAVVALIISSASDALMLSMIKPLMDESFGGLDSVESNFLAMMPLYLLGLMILRGLSGFVSAYCLSWVSGNVVMSLRRQMFNPFHENASGIL